MAQEHETLDQLCQRCLGCTRAVVEATLARNSGLAGHGPHLPAGLVVELVELSGACVTATRAVVQLWD